MKQNIFLDLKEKEALNHIKKVHNLSYSTIIDIIVRNYYIFEPFKKDVEKYNTTFKSYTSNRKKTSIKIKNVFNLTDRQINAYILYFIHDKDKEIEETEKLKHDDLMKIRESIRRSINKSFQTTIDEWANYNAFCRMKERYQRENTKTCQ